MPFIICLIHKQASAQREYEKNVSVFVEGMCNYVFLLKIFKIIVLSSNQPNNAYKILYALMSLRNISHINSKKKLRIFPVEKNGCIPPSRKYCYVFTF